MPLGSAGSEVTSFVHCPGPLGSSAPLPRHPDRGLPVAQLQPVAAGAEADQARIARERRRTESARGDTAPALPDGIGVLYYP